RRYIIKTERPELACTEQADKGRACQKRTTQPLDGCLWSITGTNNHEQPSPKTDEKTNGQLLNARLASIVPTPNGLNDSPTDVRTACVIPNGPTSADPHNARLSSSSRYNASGMTKYLSSARFLN
ncbi:hypothetical protein, partial [Pseudomonas syringae]|uniref:hypothetical protein n=1 Tax=Pseudomonas syringae TaxID=317 RepID=UPI001F3BB2AA